MTFITSLFIAVALAMDAFAVSLATGVSQKQISKNQTMRMASSFGLFQAGMTFLGWGFGITVRDYIEAYDHWIAFALLAFIGLHMISEAFGEDHIEETPAKDRTQGLTLLFLSIATSIDALAVGLGMSIINQPILVPGLLIGIVAFGGSVIGLHLGKMAQLVPFLSRYAEVIGGGVLIIIGIKILFDHGVFLDFL